MLKRYLEHRKAILLEKKEKLKEKVEQFKHSTSIQEVVDFNEQELLQENETLEKELSEVEENLKSLEVQEEEVKTPKVEGETNEERKVTYMLNREIRNKGFYQELATREKQFVQDFIDIVKRNVSGSKLLIPFEVLDVVYDVLKEDAVLSLCRLIQSDKQGRVAILTDFPEAFWVEKSGVNQNQTYAIHKVDLMDYTLEQFLAVDQNVEEDLGSVLQEIIQLMAKSIARKLVKDVFNGDGDRCTVGIIHALNTTEAPAYHAASTLPYESVKATNVKDIKILNKGGVTEYMELVQFLKSAKPHGSTNHSVIMNQATFDSLVSVIAQVPEWRISLLGNSALPLLNHVVISELLENNQIVAGYFDHYVLVLRRNDVLETSRDYKFAENKTCIKITKRIDGRPLFYNAFVSATLKPKP